MHVTQLLFAGFYQFADAFAFLVLASAGLAVIFGMMGVINLAHGEFIMCGAYVTTWAARLGQPLPLAIFEGTLAAALAGLVVEWLIVRHLYQRPLDTIVATWGVSLVVTQGTLIVLGSTMPGINVPLGSFEVGGYTYATYKIVLFLVALAVLAGLYLLFNATRFGVLARATIQVPAMAAALGVNTRTIYALTFALGSGLAGLAGGVYGPTMSLVPTVGTNFMMEAFVTVVIGGADVFLGTAPAAVILGVVRAGLTSWEGQVFGQIGLLLAVIVVVRILPRGLSSLLESLILSTRRART